MLTVPIRIQVDTDVYSTLNLAISLSKAIGGSAEFVRVTSNRQSVAYAFGATDPRDTTDLSFSAVAPNITEGVYTWSYFSGNANAASEFTDFDVNNLPTGVTISSSSGTVLDLLTVTPAAYDTLLSNNSQVVFRANRGMALDQITVIAITDAAPGANAFQVLIVPNGNTAFRNNTGSVILTAVLYEGGAIVPDGGTPDRINSYQWQKDNVNVVAAVSRTLTVNASDIADDGASLYSCIVDYD